MGRNSHKFFILFFLFSFLLLCPGTGAAGNKALGVADGFFPAPLLHITGGDAIIVEKSTHRLYLYKGRSLVKKIKVTTGKRRGNKQVVKDLKTPEGVYFLTKFLEDSELPAKYGSRAIVLDYPNPIDKFQGKTGSGIWIHGTNDPSRLKRPYDSRGCVVMLNDDVLALAGLVSLNATPVVIVEKLKMLSAKDSRAEFEKIGKWFLESFEFGFDSVEELKVIKFDAYNVVSFVKKGARRVVYFREKDGGFEVAAAAYENRAALEKAGRGKPDTVR